jgi:DNA-binding NarL/FixJ family response regulator
MVDAGAMGYVLKNEPPEKIVEAVRATAHGKEWFSQSIAVRFAEWLRLGMPSLFNRLHKS